MRLAAAAAVVLLIALHVAAVVKLAGRALAHDEAEFLHAAVLLSRGAVLYRSFVEHHPPFLFAALAALGPADGPAFAYRARWVTGAVGLLALATAALMVGRAAKRIAAAVLFTALVLTIPSIWNCAFAEVRVEAPSLLLWFGGAVMSLCIRRRTPGGSIARGIGIGLLAEACLWNPKWPIVTAVVLGFWLTAFVKEWREAPKRAYIELAAAAVAIAAGFASLAALTSLRTYPWQVLGISTAFNEWWMRTHSGPGAARFFYCPRIVLPTRIIPATVVVLLGAFAGRDRRRDRPLVLFLCIATVASLVEIRYVFSWPAIWLHYYVLWTLLACAVLALLPGAVGSLIVRIAPEAEKIAAMATPLAAAVALLFALDIIPATSVTQDPYWVEVGYLQRLLRPGDTVWTDVDRMPIMATDESPYWFGLRDFLPAALLYAKTPHGAEVLPKIAESDLPPCRLEAGLAPHLRLIAGPIHLERLPVAFDCFERLRNRGVVVATVVPDVYLVRR